MLMTLKQKMLSYVKSVEGVLQMTVRVHGHCGWTLIDGSLSVPCDIPEGPTSIVHMKSRV